MIQTLIVDDENIERQGIKRLINSYALPFQVTLASSGKMALDFIRSNAVDLMLTDVRMPIMDGLQLAEAALNEKANLQIVLISGFSEFEYAKTAMKLGVKDYLLKPVNPVEFRNTMTRIAEQIMKQNDKKDKEQFTDLQMCKYVLTCLLNGTPSEFQRMEQRREISIAFLKVYRRVFRLNFEDNFLNNIGVTNRIYQYLTKAVPGKFDFVQINDASCAFFLLFDINDDQCAQIALKLYAWSESALHQTANIVISERINSTEKLMQSVVQIKSIAKQRFLISSPILFADGQTHTQTSPSDNEQQLLEQFEKLCLDYRFSKAREILYTMRREKNFSHLFVKSGISAAAAKLFRILPEISAEQTYQIIESIWRAESMQKLCDILLPILDKAEQKFAETPVKAKKLSDLSKQYIAEHYREDISLQTISESLFISPQHLSSVFKRETGQGLANYLRAYRMKCAKELLKGTRKKVSVICKEVGYPNETYFCKIFRDLYGMSPQQYRDEGTNGKEQL